MKKRIEDYIPKALEAVEFAEIKSDGKVPKQFKGYISSFGAAIIQSGLIPAVTFFSAKGGAEEERQKVVKAIYKIIFTEEDSYKDNALLEKLIQNRNNQEALKSQIMDAAVALKLAVRTFEIK